MQRKAFTLIELLVVIAIIAILAAILFPVFAQAKVAAKRTQDLSNVKNITLGLMLYQGDADDCNPITRVSLDGQWMTPKMRIWKDMVYPYIKNGGRLPKSDDTIYSKPGDGGIFQSPLNMSAWGTGLTDGNSPGGPGDETTRFARSYALNKDAGRNETGGDTWWTEVYCAPANPCVFGRGANMSLLEKPAGTALIAPTRRIYPDVESSEIGRVSDANGNETNAIPGSLASVPSSGNGLIVFGFADGHAKHVKWAASLDNDVWGMYDKTKPGPGYQWGYNRPGPGNGKVWIEGIKTNARLIDEWK